MRPSELRIGNYVASDHFKDRDVIVKVRLIGQEQAIVEHPSGLSEPMLYQGEMRGIKLTEEILLKCGFYKTDEKYLYFERSDIVGMIQLYDGVAQYSIDSNDVCWINNLHELQNIFYALTGKELEVKLC